MAREDGLRVSFVSPGKPTDAWFQTRWKDSSNAIRYDRCAWTPCHMFLQGIIVNVLRLAQRNRQGWQAEPSLITIPKSYSSMANNTIVDCLDLVSRTSFPNYIATIRNRTGNNFALVDQCKPEICNALWGSGNPDISGIGVSKSCFPSAKLSDLTER